MKLCTIVGARPQFIKAATVSRIIESRRDVNEIIVHTGQHYDNGMSDVFFKELNIPTPGYHLNVGSASHGKQTGLMLIAIEEVLLKEKPDCVLVYGDTNSTLAGALAAVKLHIPVVHVEAGLRSFNRHMPEEINRITADHLSDLLFTPTTYGTAQLKREGIAAEKIIQVGDVMYDATLYYNELNTHRKTIVDQLTLAETAYCLATIHRAENTDTPHRLSHIIDALNALASSMQVILPLHPRTRDILNKNPVLKKKAEKINIIEPIGYLDMLAVEKNAQCIVTDSGGVQKEAYFNGVPCFTLRDQTEWVELVDAGWNQLISPEVSFSLVDAVQDWKKPADTHSQKLYGNGDAAEKIVLNLLACVPSR